MKWSGLIRPPQLQHTDTDSGDERTATWLDQKLPALDGRTPRQAAAEGGSALAELHALLDDIQWQANNSGGGMSAARIRHHLGLTDA